MLNAGVGLHLRQLGIACAVVCAQAYIGNDLLVLRKSFRPHFSVLRATVPEENEVEVEVASGSVKSRKPPDVKAFSSGYKTVFEEIPWKSCSPNVEGSLPEDLQGTYFRSGPSMFSAGSIVPPETSLVRPKQPPVPDGQNRDRMVEHPFEGDGGILAVTFAGDGKATVRFRYVRTIAFTTERKKGKRLYKAMDSTREVGRQIGNDLPLPLFRHHLQPGLNKKRKNTSNTRAVYWGNRLLSMWEGGQPYKLDARALSTEGPSRLGGALKNDEDPLGSKMVFDSKLNRAIFYGLEPTPKQSKITIYEFDSNFQLITGQDDGRLSTSFPGLSLLNDFCATEKYTVFVQPNVVADSMQYMFVKEPGKILSLEKGPSMIHLVSRVSNPKKGQASFSIPEDDFSDAGLQFINGYEDGDSVVFDAIRSDDSTMSGARAIAWPWGESMKDYQSAASRKSLWRYTIDLSTRSVSKRLLFGDHCMFGVVNPSVSTQRHRYIYMNVGALGNEAAPPQGIARFDCETETTQIWMPEEYEFCGEPMFAPRKSEKDDLDEDHGYVVSILYNGQREESEIIVLAANNIGAGPISRISLGFAIPHGLFGCFGATEEATWPSDEIERRAKLSDKMESRGGNWNEVKSDFSGLGLRLDDMEEYFGDWM